MARKFKLAEKPCTTTYVDFDAKGENDEQRAIVKFGLEDLILNAKETDKLWGEGTHERWFVKDDSGTLQPAFDDCLELKFSHRFLESSVTLDLGGKTLTLVGAKIMGIKCQRQTGGNVWTCCEIEAPIDGVENAHNLARFARLKLRAQLGFGKKADVDKRQQSLPLNEGADADDDQDDAGDDKPRKGRNGTQPAAH